MSPYEFIRDFVRRHAWLDRKAQQIRRTYLASGAGYPDWQAAKNNCPEAWETIRTGPESKGPKILIATSIGAHLAAMQMETVLAASLKARGCQVEALLCDAILPGCQMCEPRFIPDAEYLVAHGPQRDICGQCFKPGRSVYDTIAVPVHAYSDNLTDEDRAMAAKVARQTPLAEIATFEFEGLKLGDHAKAGALRFFARATIDKEAHSEPVLRRYLEAAILTALSVRALLTKHHYDVAVFHHGIYVPQGIIGEVARQLGVRVVTWHPAYRKDCFIFSHNDTYHLTLMDEPIESWQEMGWSAEREAQIEAYLQSRWHGTNDWIKFVDKPFFEHQKILTEIGCDPSKPIISCLTNVMWDAQLHYPANAFENMLEWLLFTVRYFATRPDMQLVVRVHPAEINGSVPSRQPIVAELQRHFPVLPANVFVIGPESRVSTYVLAELSDTAIIYGTKTGVELTSAGIPVIVAGEAWIRGKGVTTDVVSDDDYRQVLDNLPSKKRLGPEFILRARKYAYHFFFRRMIPVKLFEKNTAGWPPFKFSSNLYHLLENGDRGLDLICEGIISGSPFVYDEEGVVASDGNVL